MRTIFLKDIKLSRKSLIIWVIVLLLTAGFAALEYPMFIEEADMIGSTLEMMPKVVRILFGVEGLTFQQNIDYYITMYFWYVLIIYTHAAYVGATIIAREERDKTSEFIFVKPYTRSEIVTAKILVGIFHLAIIALATWLFNVLILLPMMGSGSLTGIVTISTMGMFITQLVFFGLGQLSTAYFKKYKTGLKVAMMIVLVSFIIAVILEYFGNLDYLNILSPFRYFNIQGVVNNGINLLYVLVSAVILTISIYLTYKFYKSRDLLYK
ncbi:MAG: ABC transporter permease subunit [Bacillota bacterium]